MVAAATKTTSDSSSTTKVARSSNATPDSAGEEAVATKNSHNNINNSISNSHPNNSKNSILHYIAPNSNISISIQKSPHHPSSRKNISNQHPTVYIKTTLLRVTSIIISEKSLDYPSNSIIGMRPKRSRSEEKEVAEIHDPRREKG